MPRIICKESGGNVGSLLIYDSCLHQVAEKAFGGGIQKVRMIGMIISKIFNIVPRVVRADIRYIRLVARRSCLVALNMRLPIGTQNPRYYQKW
jgi:hypothetical protein